MPKCPVCSTRKGKRSCPALESAICPSCCGQQRLVTIQCPEDCHYLQAEYYQLERRTGRARSRGRRFLAALDESFRDEGMRQLAWLIQSDLYWWTERLGARSNTELAEDLETAGRGPSRVVLPDSRSSDLAPFLAAIGASSPRYEDVTTKHGLDAEKRRRTYERLAKDARRHGPAGATSFLAETREFFGELDQEADLDYSPLEELAGHEVGAALRARLGIDAEAPGRSSPDRRPSRSESGPARPSEGTEPGAIIVPS